MENYFDTFHTKIFNILPQSYLFYHVIVVWITWFG